MKLKNLMLVASICLAVTATGVQAGSKNSGNKKATVTPAPAPVKPAPTPAPVKPAPTPAPVKATPAPAPVKPVPTPAPQQAPAPIKAKKGKS